MEPRQLLNQQGATSTGWTDQTIPGILLNHSQRAPGATAIAAPGRRPLSYGRLGDQIEAVVEALRGMGVERNDRVAIVLPNGPEMAVAFLSVASGATCAPLNPAYGAKEFDFYLSDLNARALLILAGMDSAARAAALSRKIPIVELVPILDEEAGIFSLVGDQAHEPAAEGYAEPGDVALVLHTSGTTSRPKIVPLTHANLCASALNIRDAYRLGVEDRCLNVMPLFHIHGLVAAILSTLTSGASVVCTPGFDDAEFFGWLDTFQPTWYTAVPTMHQAILKRAESHREVIARRPMRFVRSCSAALPPQVMAALEDAFGVPALEAYGMTEASHQMSSNPLPPAPRKPSSVGVATGPEVAIMDEAGTLVAAGEKGEIVIRGANVTHGYENNPEANKGSFTRGWFRTGDEGFLDRDGYLFITGRIKEIINRGGEKVAPREVDEALLDHPAVAQAVTFAVPHATLGEDVAAAVVLREGTSVTEHDLREIAFARLADFKVPSQVIIVDEIPKGPTGKLQRIGLHEKLAPRLKSEFAPPRNIAEEALARIWCEVLGVEQVGVFDNFFGLGGDSLRATQVVTRVRAAFQVDLPATTMFREPTIAGQADQVEEKLISELEAMSEEEAQRLAE
jgi:acyl-CoA synthetase (AMP-forming)/AMP-acid ligase II/acyl carrier protein